MKAGKGRKTPDLSQAVNYIQIVAMLTIYTKHEILPFLCSKELMLWMEDISMHSNAVTPGGHRRLQVAFSLLCRQQSREMGFLTESNKIVPAAPTLTWSQHSKKALVSLPGCFLANREETQKTVRIEILVQLLPGLNV